MPYERLEVHAACNIYPQALGITFAQHQPCHTVCWILCPIILGMLQHASIFAMVHILRGCLDLGGVVLHACLIGMHLMWVGLYLFSYIGVRLSCWWWSHSYDFFACRPHVVFIARGCHRVWSPHFGQEYSFTRPQITSAFHIYSFIGSAPPPPGPPNELAWRPS